MRVIHLSLKDFRNYRSAEVSFEAGRNLVIGRNGQGKTNLVEAMAYFGSLSSHRVTSDTALIRAGSEAGVARMRVGVADREASLELQINRGRSNHAQVNGSRVRPRELTRWFSSVVFAPEDLTIVRGEPSLRRRFLDDAVIARNPAMAGTMSDYDRVLRQRTSLLKSARAQGSRAAVDSTIEVWDEQLATLGGRLMDERRRLVEDLREPLTASYCALVEADHRPEMELNESVSEHVSRETSTNEASTATANVSRETLVEEFRRALESARPQELDRGVTLVGPHRDDLVFNLNGLPVKGYASHGESWSFALSLRLALAAILREESAAGDPVIILDDVFAELDSDRRSRLMGAVDSYEQVIVTAAVEEDIPEADGSGESWHRIRVSAGEILSEGSD